MVTPYQLQVSQNFGLCHVQLYSKARYMQLDTGTPVLTYLLATTLSSFTRFVAHQMFYV